MAFFQADWWLLSLDKHQSLKSRGWKTRRSFFFFLRGELLVLGSVTKTTPHHLKEIKPRSAKHKKYGAPGLTHFSCGLLSCRAKGQKIFIPGGMSSQVDVNFKEYKLCKLYEFDIHIIYIYIPDFYPSKLGIFVGRFDSEDCPKPIINYWISRLRLRRS